MSWLHPKNTGFSVFWATTTEKSVRRFVVAKWPGGVVEILSGSKLFKMTKHFLKMFVLLCFEWEKCLESTCLFRDKMGWYFTKHQLHHHAMSFRFMDMRKKLKRIPSWNWGMFHSISEKFLQYLVRTVSKLEKPSMLESREGSSESTCCRDKVWDKMTLHDLYKLCFLVRLAMLIRICH